MVLTPLLDHRTMGPGQTSTQSAGGARQENISYHENISIYLFTCDFVYTTTTTGPTAQLYAGGVSARDLSRI